MRKKVFFVALGLCMVLCACGDSSEKTDTASKSTNDVSTTEEITTEAKKTTYSVGETVVGDEYEVTVVRTTKGDALHFIENSGNLNGKKVYPDDSDFWMAGNKSEIKHPLVTEKSKTGEEVLVSIEVTIKFKGKEQPTFGYDPADIDIVYGDGYTFGTNECVMQIENNGWWVNVHPSYKPLSDEVQLVRMSYNVSKKAFENLEEPLVATTDLVIDGTSQKVSWNLR